MKKLISMLLVLVMCTLALTSCGGVNGSPESVVEAAMGLMEDPDVKTLKNLLPEVAWETLYDEADMDEDEFWEDVEDSFEEAKEMMEDYEGFKFSFEIDEVDDMKRSEVKDLNEELEDFLDDDIEEAAVVTVEVAFSLSSMVKRSMRKARGSSPCSSMTVIGTSFPAICLPSGNIIT